MKRTLIMGIVNVTPDSFSDGGRWANPEAAIERALTLVADGADIIDVGGESTRPGTDRVSQSEERRRALPVVHELVGRGVTVSVDTMRADIAAEAIEAGAAIINDVSGGLADPQMFQVVAAADVDYVVMHWRGHSAHMQNLTQYDDVVTDVIAETTRQVAAAISGGINPGRIIVDPGIGFAKTPDQNWELLRHLEAWDILDHRLLLGVSRKRFLGELLAENGQLRQPDGRDAATAALTAVAATLGVWAVRTHSVREHVDAVKVIEKLRSPNGTNH